MRRYLATVNECEFDITVEYRSDKYLVTCNDRKIEVTASFLGESRALVLMDNESHEIDVRANGYDPNRVVFVRGLEIPVVIEDYNLAQLRKTAGMAAGGAVENDVRAAMPGLIVKVKVKPGDTVKKGQPLLIVEAMKMENIVKSPRDGTVKAVHIEANGLVEKNDRLLEFE